MKKWLFVLLIILSNISNLISQSSTIDSLKLALKTAKHDTTRCNILVELSDICSEEDLPKFNEQLKTIAENNLKQLQPKQPQYNLFIKHLASAFNNIGLEFNSKGNIAKAMEYWSKSLELQKEIGDKRGIIVSLNNIGFIYKAQGNISKALEYHSKSLKISEEIGDKAEIANTLSFIAIIYRTQGDINKALDYYTKSLKLQEEVGDRIGIAYSLNNIGYVYQQMGDPSVTSSKEDAERAGHFKALDYYLKSVKILEEVGDKQGYAYALTNAGVIYYRQGDPSVKTSKQASLKAGATKALEIFLKSLKILKEVGNYIGIANCYNNIGRIYMDQKNYTKAIEYSSNSLKVSQEAGFPENIAFAANSLQKGYKMTGNYKLALENYELYIQMSDSINNAETKKASIKTQLKYEYEKQAAADSVKNAEAQKVKDAQLQAQSASLKQEKTKRYALYGGLVLIAGFLVFVFNRFRITNKQKKIIEEQKIQVDTAFEKLHEKNKEVMDSIHYAKRIQSALMPNAKYIERVLKNLN